MSLSNVADVLTIVIVSSTLLAVLLRPRRFVKREILKVPFLRPLRRPERWNLEQDDTEGLFGVESGSLLSRERARDELATTITGAVQAHLNGLDITPADVLARLIAHPRFEEQARDWPMFAAALGRLMRAASTSGAQSLLGRLLYPEDVRSAQALSGRLASHLERFGYSYAVPVKAPGAPVAFADFATALTGAVILVDSSETRSRYADSILLWHRREYRGAPRPQGLDSLSDQDWTRRGYGIAHPNGQACSLKDVVSDRRTGDYDRLVLHFRSACLAESSTQGRLEFVLETSETCYLATEQGEAITEDDLIRGCKHLLPSNEHDPFMSLTKGDDRVLLNEPDVGRFVLTTSYVALITSDNVLALAKRTGFVRHGQDVISATAGGVIEPEQDGGSGDVDNFGMPSPLIGVLREAHEELGVSLNPEAIKPVAVFLANVRNVSQGERCGRGQLVMTALYLGRIGMTFAELKDEQCLSSPSLGSFEVERLEPVELTSGEEASQLAGFAALHAKDLDQHGMLSCLYASVVLSGPEKTREAFEEAFPEQPWWAIPAANINPRIVRDPRLLVANANANALHSDAPYERCGPKAWQASWKELDSSLAAARDSMLSR